MCVIVCVCVQPSLTHTTRVGGAAVVALPLSLEALPVESLPLEALALAHLPRHADVLQSASREQRARVTR